ncbi:NAD-binding protein [Sunxiuqinia indica]|uniref:NAD-binding protein n=1 Tax=Sunxiuqinia indica TaxID=2692584 RepID=UPI00191527E3|nr:NAD-binding protein [Sunxiuqinia indica]
MDAKIRMMMDRNYEPGFRIDLHIKDLNSVLETSRGVGVSVFLAAQVMETMQAIKQNGCGVEGHSSIVKFYEKLANIEVAW